MNQPQQPSAELTDPRLLQLAPEDNVAVARRTIAAGEQILIAGQMVRAVPGVAAPQVSAMVE